MNLFHSYGKFILFASLVLSLSVAADTDPREPQDTDLDIIEQSRYGEILVAPGIDWSTYSKVQLEKATVAFRENWARDLKRHSDLVIRERDEERIKSGLVSLLDEVLTQELFLKEDFTMTDESGADVMRITPRIVDLDIYAPDRVRNYIGGALADSKGRMTLELEIHDSVSGELLATSWQYQEDPYDGYMEQANSVTNRQAFRLMLLRWATWLREWLKTPRKTS
jgi:hypothetical protein